MLTKSYLKTALPYLCPLYSQQRLLSHHPQQKSQVRRYAQRHAFCTTSFDLAQLTTLLAVKTSDIRANETAFRKGEQIIWLLKATIDNMCSLKWTNLTWFIFAQPTFSPTATPSANPTDEPTKKVWTEKSRMLVKI
jgi:hypothetical protein